MVNEKIGGLRGLGWAYEGGFDGGGDADELGDGVGEEVGDPEIAAGVDGDGEGSEEVGVGGPAGGGGDGLAAGLVEEAPASSVR